MSLVTRFPTSVGTSEADSITLLGHDLPSELIGQVGFGELAYWLITQRRPPPGQARVFDAVRVPLPAPAFPPTAIAARLTYLSAPDALQGALAAGLLGGGSRFLGVTEDTGVFLAEALASVDELPDTEAGWDELAAPAILARRAAGLLVPGLGHPVHKAGDPRTPVLISLAREAGVYGPYLRLFESVGRVHPAILGRTLPLNGAGVCGAALADAGIDVALLRGVALLARCAGLLGHLAEEMRRPVANDIYMTVDRNAQYLPPDT